MLSLHVLAAILTVGPVTVASWLYVLQARSVLTLTRSGPVDGVGASAHEGADTGPTVLTTSGAQAGDTAMLTLLHRVCMVGGIAALSVPVFGVATAEQLEALTDLWLLSALALTVIAAAVFVVGVLPSQRRWLGNETAPAQRPGGASSVHLREAVVQRLWRATTVFTSIWMVVVTLMVFRPGSTGGGA